MIAPIICGVDGKPHSWRTLRVANELALRTGRRLHVLHVTPAAGEPPQREQGDRLHSVLEGDPGRNDPAVLLESGAPAQRLIEASRQAAALVIGTHGHSALRQAARGSLSTAVIRAAACPVVVVPARIGHGSHSTLDDTNVLCAVRDIRDLAPAATAACWARDLGLDLVLGSVEPTPRVPVAGIGAPPPMLIANAGERSEASSHDLEDVARGVAPIASNVPTTRVITGPVGRGLRWLATQERASLVVVGPCHRSIIGAIATRSPAWYLHHRSSHPVMVCPSAEAALGDAARAALRPPARSA